MKKFLIIVATVVVLTVAGVFFEVPDRVDYAFNGMSSYDMDKYTETKFELHDETFNITLPNSDYEKETTLLEFDGMKLILKKVEFVGTGYNVYIESVGVSEFDYGRIISMDDVSDLTFQSEECGKMMFSKTGRGFGKDTIRYTFSIYPITPSNEKYLPDLKCSLEIKDLYLKDYIRKEE
jgi:hypothetical protein